MALNSKNDTVRPPLLIKAPAGLLASAWGSVVPFLKIENKGIVSLKVSGLTCASTYYRPVRYGGALSPLNGGIIDRIRIRMALLLHSL